MSVQEKIQQLLWNKRYVAIPNELAPPNIEYVLIRDMTNEDRNIYTFTRKRELESARKQGVLTEVELLAEARKIGLWTDEDDLVLAKSDDHIEFLKSEIERQKHLSRKKSIQKDIEKTIERKQTTLIKKNEHYINSADYYAAEIASTLLVRRLVYNLEGQLLFPNDDTFLLFKRDYHAFIIFLTNQVLSEGLWEIDEIREVARHPEWRLTWTLQRENLPGIFGRNISDLTITQKLVIYWSRVYDSAFESTEPPTVDIVNDDNKFDDWLVNRDLSSQEKTSNKSNNVNNHQERMQSLEGTFIEVCNCGAKDKNAGKGLGERIMHPNTCPYGTYHRYSQQEKERIANQIYGRNSDRVRNLIDKEQQTIIEKGILEEQNLRSQKTRHMLGMKTDVTSINKK